MRLENRSRHLLAVTKSKAKMYEFGLEEEHHIELPMPPQKLLLVTIGILGDFAAMEAREELEDNYAAKHRSLKEQLVDISQYFDALNESRLKAEIADYLCLLGSAAYYLADMPGSSLVLSKHLKHNIEELTESYIEGVLVWLLKGDYEHDWFYSDDDFTQELSDFVSRFYHTYKNGSGRQKLNESINRLRDRVYQLGSDRELFIVDIIGSIAKRKIENSTVYCLPRYTKLKISIWQSSLDKDGFMREFWPAQKLLGEKGVFEGQSAVVQMPTSAGKTKSTELIIRSAFLSGRTSLAIVVAPFRALCREISESFKKAFAQENITINELQDIPQLNLTDLDMIDELLQMEHSGVSQTSSIIISTPEKLVYLLRHEPSIANNLGLLIFDEGHQFDAGTRGVTYELLLSSLRTSIQVNAQLILISAVISNAESIGDWLYGENGIEVKGTHCLPTLRTAAFTSWTGAMGQLRYINHDDVDERDFFVPRVIRQVNLGRRPREQNDRIFPEKNDNTSMSAYLGLKLCQQAPTAVFCGTKKTISSITELLVDYFARGLRMGKPVDTADANEIEKIACLAGKHFSDKSILSEGITLGILPHGSNVPNGLRVSVEWAMENNKASLVICTSTLAQGVNLPIKYLVISSTFQAGQKISARDFHNLIGRVGRSGYHTEGSIIFANSDIFDKRKIFREKWKWERALHLLDPSNSEACLSSLKQLIEPISVGSRILQGNKYIAEPDKYREICLKLVAGKEAVELAFELDRRKQIIKTIESYFMSYLKDYPNAGSEDACTELAQGTLAYHLSDDTEKGLLVEAFSLIFAKIMNVKPEKLAYFGKALLGLDELLFIENWLDDNYEVITGQLDVQQLLIDIWPLLTAVSSHKLFEKIQPVEKLNEAALCWINGESYHEIYQYFVEQKVIYRAGRQKRKITMDQVVEFTDNALGYEATLIVGALADVVEGRYQDDLVVEKLHFLQNSLKLGLPTSFEHWLYSKGFVDREVCKVLATELIESGLEPENFGNRLFKTHKKIIDRVLSKMPTYFSNVILN